MTLSRQDWLDEGLRSLADLGHDGLRVEAMARRLGTTKGSFYWHFKGLEDFQGALLQLWEASVTAFDQTPPAECPEERLHKFWEPAGAEAAQNVTLAVRLWARERADVAAVVARVDRRRQIYLAESLAQAGFEGARLPLLVHAVQLGLDQLEQSLGPMPKAARRALLRPPDAA